MSKLTAVWTLTVFAAGFAHAQTYERRATMTGGGNPGEGRCTIEIVVDGAAQVEVRGDRATLQNLKGQPPQWRRFECSAVMPANAPNFRFRGVDGRGKVELIQAPQNGGPAVVRIDDPDNGSEGYTFEFTWGGGFTRDGGPREAPGYGPPPAGPQPYGPPPSYGPPAGPRRILTDDAIRLCQDYVRNQAMQRYGVRDVRFRRTNMDDNPGRNDWVTGSLEGNGRNGRPQDFSFSCSVNFDSGQVRSADLRPIPPGRGFYGGGGPDRAGSDRAMNSCEAAVEDRLGRDGFMRPDFGSISFDDRPGRNDWITGTATASDRGRPAWFDFSCQVDLRAGTVSSVDVHRR